MAVNAGFILQHKQVFPRLCFLAFFIVLSTYRFYSKAIVIRIFLFEIEG